MTVRFPAGAIGLLPSADALTVGDPRVVRFLGALSARLLAPSVARAHPELGSLGFFLRRAELARTAETLRKTDQHTVRRPRGLIFHVPPANVDTVFVYSWALSALAGNRNVVRLSRRSAGAADAVLAALNDALADADPVIARTQRMVAYGRDDAVTAELSAACDLRVLWGGDASVTELRRFPLSPLARDLTFPDRSSFAALSATGWLAAGDDARRTAADGYANDVYWFDQAACSSPRALYVTGTPADVKKALESFRRELADAVARRGWTVDAAMAVEKRVRAYGLAADGRATGVRFPSNELAWLRLADAGEPPRGWLGTGVVAVARLDALRDLAPLITPRDQTLSHFGFGAGELRGLVEAVPGRGLDRIVPFGQALSFAPVWDGHDLLEEFTTRTTIRG
ncbi:acyl-CoA reductase [Catenuloplanes japonicus]|uniref:acyl-CoA reductase n=1 Tax=Catenuloplanes japonicus TaxID=33876 RepID=UPI000524E0D1|nr:acyl-CoA reductase [Catenuloplanes japonicus]